jgi:hypothetical protein
MNFQKGVPFTKTVPTKGMVILKNGLLMTLVYYFQKNGLSTILVYDRPRHEYSERIVVLEM